ncbi:MAG TPA: hypothetical protein VF014_10095 [Casimicrobiaceae bacterium]|nr:hypothetical protein [Casimicrobiaceae bacterium]
MSRAHDRAYRLLSERIRLGAAPRRALYATLLAAIASGVWWLIAHYGRLWLPSPTDDLRRLAQEGAAMKVHGAAAFAVLIALGAMSANHMRRGWSLARNRASGSVVIAVFGVLVVTGYALYYWVDDATRPPVSVLHWLLGLGLAPVVTVHILAGRRSRTHPQEQRVINDSGSAARRGRRRPEPTLPR